MFDGIWVQTGTTHLILSKQSNVIVFGGLFFEVRNNSQLFNHTDSSTFICDQEKKTQQRQVKTLALCKAL